MHSALSARRAEPLDVAAYQAFMDANHFGELPLGDASFGDVCCEFFHVARLHIMQTAVKRFYLHIVHLHKKTTQRMMCP
jgi:hypothetical protein